MKYNKMQQSKFSLPVSATDATSGYDIVMISITFNHYKYKMQLLIHLLLTLIFRRFVVFHVIMKPNTEQCDKSVHMLSIDKYYLL